MKIWKPILLIAAILSSAVTQASDAPAPWLVQVSSVYRADDGRRVKITGTGTIVRIADKHYVLCDSHLSQGQESLSLVHPEKGLLQARPAERLADNLADLELIEITDPEIGQSFHYDPVAKEFTLPIREARDLSFPRAPMADYSTFIPEVPWSQQKAKPWRKRRQLEVHDLFLKPFRNGEEIKSMDGSEAFVDAGVSPGASGSPLLKVNQERSHLVLSGLAKSFHRYFDLSYFSTRKQIGELVSAFSAGKRGSLDQTRWRYGRFTYRELGNGTYETSDGRQPSGDAVSADAGNGTSGDAGNGASGDAGNGTSGDAGDDGAMEKPISQGMVYRGKPVLGFEVQTFDRSVPIYGDLAGWRFAEEARKKGKKVIPIPAGADLSAQLRKKLDQVSDEPSSDKGVCYIDSAALGEGLLRIRLPYNSKGNDRPMAVEVPLKSAPSFLRFKSDGGDSYTVDLRGLFFGVASSIQGDTSGLPYDVLIHRFGMTPYIEMQRGEYLAENFTCSPAGSFTFVGSEKLSWQELERQHAYPCFNQPKISEPVSELTSDVARALEKNRSQGRGK